MHKIAEDPKGDRGIDKISKSNESAKGGICPCETQIASKHRCSVDRAACRASQGTCCGETFAASANEFTHTTLRISSKMFSFPIYPLFSICFSIKQSLMKLT